MKRPSKPVNIAETPPPSRRKRVLREDEQELWELVAKQVKPLRKKPRLAKTLPRPLAEDLPAASKSAVVSAKSQPVPRLTKIVRPAPPSAPPLAPLGRRERSQLSRGKKEIDARLDLHGMTQTRAHHALVAFLHRAHHDGLTFVLVITGKGRTVGPESERGVLRRQVPQWLSLPELRSFVVGFEEAHIGHGGGGALYVRIRRSRL